jgi:hypothetical protein
LAAFSLGLGCHTLNAEYFRRIDALNYTMMHDDGQLADDLEEADVVLIGVSRTSKTVRHAFLLALCGGSKSRWLRCTASDKLIAPCEHRFAQPGRLQPRLLKCPWDFIECRQR